MAWTDEARLKSIQVRRLNALLHKRYAIKKRRHPFAAPMTVGDILIHKEKRAKQFQQALDVLDGKNQAKMQKIFRSWRKNATSDVKRIATGMEAARRLRAEGGGEVVACYDPSKGIMYIGHDVEAVLSPLQEPLEPHSPSQLRWVLAGISTISHEFIHSLRPKGMSLEEFKAEKEAIAWSRGLMGAEEAFTEAYNERVWPEFASKLGIYEVLPDLKKHNRPFAAYESLVGAAEFLANRVAHPDTDPFDSFSAQTPSKDTFLEYLMTNIGPKERCLYVAALMKQRKLPEVEDYTIAQVNGALISAFGHVFAHGHDMDDMQGAELFQEQFLAYLARIKKRTVKNPGQLSLFNAPPDWFRVHGVISA